MGPGHAVGGLPLLAAAPRHTTLVRPRRRPLPFLKTRGGRSLADASESSPAPPDEASAAKVPADATNEW